jgi:protein gp37
MSTVTSIEWTERSWNPTSGCDRISAGCDNCYALTMAKRLKGMGSAKYQNDGDPRTSGPGFGVTVHPDALTEPLKWRKPGMVFVNSMSDLFHARVPREFVVRVFAVMAATPHLTYQILTKRPERAARMLTDLCDCRSGHVPGVHFRSDMEWAATPHSPTYVPGLKSGIYHRTIWPLPNVWIGTSIESDQHVRRADALRNTPAAVRFISAEPLLGPLPSLDLTGIDWLIAGGESGPGARPMDLAWVRDLLGRCRTAGTAPFVKQLGSVWAADTHVGGQALSRTDKKGHGWEHWPADLRVREFPRVAEAVSA